VCSYIHVGSPQNRAVPPEWETFQTPAEIYCQNRPATGNGCSEETFCGCAMLIQVLPQSQSSYDKVEGCDKPLFRQVLRFRILQYVSISFDTES
jgi:hypothetical protein